MRPVRRGAAPVRRADIPSGPVVGERLDGVSNPASTTLESQTSTRIGSDVAHSLVPAAPACRFGAPERRNERTGGLAIRGFTFRVATDVTLRSDPSRPRPGAPTRRSDPSGAVRRVHPPAIQRNAEPDAMRS
ncbi:MAG: hypothetical protein ACYCV7_06750 [Acidimicrobiales bacterium]